MPKSSKRRIDARRDNRNRRERLEELRRQQKAAERRKNFMFVGAAIVIAVGLIAAAVIPAYLHDRAEAKKSKTGYQAKPTAAEKAAGCLGVHNDPISPAGQHITDAIDYAKEKYGDTNGGTPPIPPTGGKHHPVSLGDTNRFYPLKDKPRPERAVHNLEHGYVVVWYDDKAAADQVAHLQALVAQGNYSRMLGVGWWQGELPAGKHIVLTAWGRTERCGSLSDAVVSSFYKKHLNSSLAPESGSGPITGADTYPSGVLPSASPAPTASPEASESASAKAGATASPTPTSTK